METLATKEQKPIIRSGKGYDVSGEKHKKTIFFVHGIRVSRKMWHAQHEALSGEFRVISIDLPGHGERKNEKFSVEKTIEIIHDTILKLKLDKVLLVGFSLGGLVVSKYISKYPGTTLGAILVSATIQPRPKKKTSIYSLPFKIFNFLARNLNSGFLNRVEKKIWIKQFGHEMAGPIVDGGFYHDAIQDVFREIPKGDYLGSLKQYPNPVLLINGEKDLIFRKHEKLYLDNIPKSQLYIMIGGHHGCIFQEPWEFNFHLRWFSKSIDWAFNNPPDSPNSLGGTPPPDFLRPGK